MITGINYGRGQFDKFVTGAKIENGWVEQRPHYRTQMSVSVSRRPRTGTASRKSFILSKHRPTEAVSDGDEWFSIGFQTLYYINVSLSSDKETFFSSQELTHLKRGMTLFFQSSLVDKVNL